MLGASDNVSWQYTRQLERLDSQLDEVRRDARLSGADIPSLTQEAERLTQVRKELIEDVRKIGIPLY
ncbi:hypothetical protein [uncultured Thiocystis sp.]|jgi:uncharacterized protein YoxC|uniref:hypothetical protein n=1 Tax=uncultured Thiocystis sp. TaxID=1202134 RepID=UPI0025FC7735|nr:hypothetical protein [uncultured Thiocystis sp.]